MEGACAGGELSCSCTRCGPVHRHDVRPRHARAGRRCAPRHPRRFRGRLALDAAVLTPGHVRVGDRSRCSTSGPSPPSARGHRARGVARAADDDRSMTAARRRSGPYPGGGRSADRAELPMTADRVSPQGAAALDTESEDWLRRLRGHGAERERALADLHRCCCASRTPRPGVAAGRCRSRSPPISTTSASRRRTMRWSPSPRSSTSSPAAAASPPGRSSAIFKVLDPVPAPRLAWPHGAPGRRGVGRLPDARAATARRGAELDELLAETPARVDEVLSAPTRHVRRRGRTGGPDRRVAEARLRPRGHLQVLHDSRRKPRCALPNAGIEVTT